MADTPFERERDGYLVSTDPARIDVDAVHAFLAGTYWAANVPRAVVERSLRHSLCFGLYHAGAQVGFARVISDHATYAYLADVYVLEAHRGRRLGHFIVETVMAHPELQGLRRWSLVTRDAHPLYRDFGFQDVADATRYMEIVHRDAYR